MNNTYTNHVRSITIGSFDGLHLAHQELIGQVDMIVAIERNGGYLTAGYKRSCYTDKPITFFHFSKIRTFTPKEFVSKLQEDFPQLQKIVIGYDFHFGKNKAGNAQLLRELFDGEVVIVDVVKVNGIAVHSRTIKALLREGDITAANTLLGRAYRIDGKVIRGQGIGGKSLVPTINLQVEHYQLPKEGVYATKTKIGDTWLPSVSFIGHRKSTDGSFAVETHIPDQDLGIIHGRIWIECVDFIRENRRFEDLDALKKQIKEDIQTAQRILT